MTKVSLPGPVDRYFIDLLENIEDRLGEKEVTKWLHYFAAYTRELGVLRSKPVTFLEIGIFKGGSLPMWRGFFHEDSTLVFVDIDEACRAHAIPNTHVRIGNQADPAFLRELADEFGPFDVVLDDGSHLNPHQIASFEGLWPHLKDGGLYLVEDVHTSYWPGFGGGYRNEASFIEYAKRLIDKMHSWYTDQDGLFAFDDIARDLNGVRFYDSIVAIEKRRGDMPTYLAAGKGKVTIDRTWIKKRGRRSVFRGKDGG